MPSPPVGKAAAKRRRETVRQALVDAGVNIETWCRRMRLLTDRVTARTSCSCGTANADEHAEQPMSITVPGRERTSSDCFARHRARTHLVRAKTGTLYTVPSSVRCGNPTRRNPLDFLQDYSEWSGRFDTTAAKERGTLRRQRIMNRLTSPSASADPLR